MRWIVPWIAVFALAAALPVMAATPPAKKQQKKEADWPKKADVNKALNREKLKKSDACETHVRGKLQRFVPADISDIDDQVLERGVILGKLDLDGESKGGLEPGHYDVFAWKDRGRWQVYFTREGEVEAKCQDLEANQHVVGEPRFMRNGAAIYYWHLIFSF